MVGNICSQVCFVVTDISLVEVNEEVCVLLSYVVIVFNIAVESTGTMLKLLAHDLLFKCHI